VKLEYPLIVFICLLLVCGLTALSSAATPTDFHKQLLGIALALIPMTVIWRLGRKRLHNVAPWLYALSLLLLILTALFGREVNGNRNWLALGPLQLQPVEIAKLGLILMLAWVMKAGYQSLRSYLVPLGVFGIVFGLVVSHDFGDAMVLAVIFFSTLLTFKVPAWHLALMVLSLAVLFPTVILPHLKPYQQARLTSFIDPTKDARGSGYQVTQAMIAEGSGGFEGKGYRQGTQIHKGFVYSQQSDFIFAAWAEEEGFIGCVGLMILFGALIWRMAIITSGLADLQDQLVVTGVLGWVGTQIVENIGASISMLPLTGITLPLISYGLTSLIMILTALACVIVIQRDRNNDKI
jgi:rod shape determining protein RodA